MGNTKKERCELIFKALKGATWLSGGSVNDVKSLNNCINDFEAHIASGCRCTLKNSDKLIIAVAYYNKYLIYCHNSKVKLLRELGKSDEKLDSRITPTLLNEKMENGMLWPLKMCISKLWEVFIIAHSEAPPDKLLQDLMIVDIIKAMFFIFDCYKESDYQVHAIRLLITIGKKNLKENGFHHELILAYHCLIQVYLDYNLVNLATKTLEDAKSVLKGVTEDSFESGLISLDEICIDIITNNIDEGVKKLKNFLKLSFLKSQRITRRYLKLSALIILTSLPPENSPYTLYEEFLEAISILRQCLANFHDDLLSLESSPKEDEKISTPAEDFLRFMIYSAGFKFFSSLMSFCLNTGMHGDIERYYNTLFTIARGNCFVYWSIKLILSASTLEASLSKMDDSMTKIEKALAAMRVGNTSEKGKLDQISENADKKAYPSNDVKETDKALGYGHNSTDGSPKECNHVKELNIREIDLALKKKVPQIDDVDVLSDRPFKSLIETVQDKKYPLNVLYIEVLANSYFLQKKIDTEAINLLKEYIQDTSTRIKDGFQRICKKLVIKIDEFDSRNLNEVVHLKLELSRIVFFSLPQKEKFVFLYNTLNTLVAKNISTSLNYADCSCFLRLVYELILLKLKDLDLPLNVEAYDALKIEQRLVKTNALLKTPVKTRRNPQRTLKAPPRTGNYKMKELEGYVKGLRTASESETSEKVKRPTTATLDFDVDLTIESTTRSAVSPERQERNIKRPTHTRGFKASTPLKRAPPKQKASKCKTSPDMVELIDLVDDLDLFSLSPYAPLCNWLNKTKIDKTVLKKHLLELLRFMGNRPMLDLYSSIKQHLFTLSLNSKSSDLGEATSHLIDSANNIIRYRAVITSHRRKRINCSRILPCDLMAFEVEKEKKTDLCDILLKNIPKSWRVLQIQSINIGDGIADLVLSRYQNGVKPILIRIKCNNGKFTSHFVEELKNILELIDLTIRKKDRDTFWTAREALESRFSSLLDSVSNTWLGPFQGLILGQPTDERFNKLIQKFSSTILELFEVSACINVGLVEVLAESFLFLSEEQFKMGMLFLFPQNSVEDIEECYHKCLNIFKVHYKNQEASQVLSEITHDPIGLVIGKGLSSFPFESLSLCRSSRQQVFRTPSLRFLVSQLNFFQEKSRLDKLNPESVFYLLNPNNNLPRTEARFKDKFLSQESWVGFISQPPDPKKIAESLSSKDLYLYFGHGAGSSHFRSQNGIDCMDIKSVGLILGCSSGYLHDDNIAGETCGTPFRYLMCGSPAFLGLLWDVTDGDIDRYADRLLQTIIPKWNSEKGVNESSLSIAIAAARYACRLKFSTGAATVLYGLPVSLST